MAVSENGCLATTRGRGRSRGPSPMRIASGRSPRAHQWGRRMCGLTGNDAGAERCAARRGFCGGRPRALRCREWIGRREVGSELTRCGSGSGGGAAGGCPRWRGSRDSNFSHAEGSVRERLSGGSTRAGKGTEYERFLALGVVSERDPSGRGGVNESETHALPIRDLAGGTGQYGGGVGAGMIGWRGTGSRSGNVVPCTSRVTGRQGLG